MNELHGITGLRVDRALSPILSIYSVDMPRAVSAKFLRAVKRYPHLVQYVQRDHELTPRARVPNDPDLDASWALSPPTAIVGAPDAWSVTTGGRTRLGDSIVVAVLDDGLDLDHSDLSPNLWKSRGEIDGDGTDNDGNGYTDDVHGWNPADKSDKIPNSWHGTSVAGVIGARGNNGLGLAGVNWAVEMMPVVVLPLMTSRMIEGLNYILAQKTLWLATDGKLGANVVAVNMSFGLDKSQCTRAEFPVWDDLFDELGRVGILTVAATTNLGINVDLDGDVPTSCKSRYLVSVTSTDRKDRKPSQAGFGRTTIDLGAPGVSVAVLDGDHFRLGSGTSYAAPFVAGAVALMHAAASYDFLEDLETTPSRGADILRGYLMGSVDPVPDLASWTVSGGRLNLSKAVRAIRDYRTWKAWGPWDVGNALTDFSRENAFNFPARP